jgi:hypothetical protein
MTRVMAAAAIAIVGSATRRRVLGVVVSEARRSALDPWSMESAGSKTPAADSDPVIPLKASGEKPC